MPLSGALLLVLGSVPFPPLQTPASSESELSGEAVNAAIDRGLAFLLQSQNRDGSFGVDLYERGTPWHDFRNGASGLALYTLIHCGLPADHPARQRVEAFLLAEFPTHTYGISAQIMALGATGEPAHEKRMKKLLDALLDIEKSGGWDYPGFAAPPDLSNTQLAALALWAAEKAGMRVPSSAWLAAVETALDHQEKPASLEHPTSGESREAAGFFYTANNREPSASMTTAGLSILRLALSEPGRVKPSMAARLERASAQGIAWLENNFAVDRNPGGYENWRYYYLYGLERVAALNDMDRIAERDWYVEGALQLLKDQLPSGGWQTAGRTAWPPAPMPIANTCFALLFLRRATLSKPGTGTRTFHTTEGPTSKVWIRVNVKQKWALWLSGFSEEVRALGELGVESVEWWVDGQLFEGLSGDAEAAWDGERFAVQLTPNAQQHEIECRLRARVLQDPAAEPLELRSAKLVVRGQARLEPWMLEYAASQSQNRLAEARVALEVSSEESRFHPAGDVVDGLQGSAWLAQAGDEWPWVKLELKKKIRTKEILLSPAAASEVLRETCARVELVELRINGSKKAIEVEMNSDPRLKTRVELPRAQSIDELEIHIVSADTSGGGLVGLAEIELR